MQLTNCHVHTFTHKHAPDRFAPFPLNKLLRIGWFRAAVFAIVRRFDRGRRGKIARLVQILRVSYGKSQAEVFTMVRGFYPDGTRFVVLPMDMELMGLGKVEESADVQHDQLVELHKQHQNVVIPFAAADPRQPDICKKTVDRLEQQKFKGIKLYPPTGYHPADPVLSLFTPMPRSTRSRFSRTARAPRAFSSTGRRPSGCAPTRSLAHGWATAATGCWRSSPTRTRTCPSSKRIRP